MCARSMTWWFDSVSIGVRSCASASFVTLVLGGVVWSSSVVVGRRRWAMLARRRSKNGDGGTVAKTGAVVVGGGVGSLAKSSREIGTRPPCRAPYEALAESRVGWRPPRRARTALVP